jgi:hypothetical protein
MFGLLGAVTAKATQDRAFLTVNLTDGERAFYEILGESATSVRAKIAPLLNAAGIPFEDELPMREPDALPTDLADLIRKLAALRDEGILTEAEFQTKKARLLEQ